MITVGQLKVATCATTVNANIFLPHIIYTLDKYRINTPIRILSFLAQIGHESGGLFYTEELASGTAYEGRIDLGNTQMGDGRKYKGRGLIRIKGRANYLELKNAFGENFIDNPELLGGKNITVCSLNQLRYAALSAGWYWEKNKLNDLADKIDINKPLSLSLNNLKFFASITKIINGDINGLQDRVDRYEKGRLFFQ